jgi:hypothetical protein
MDRCGGDPKTPRDEGTGAWWLVLLLPLLCCGLPLLLSAGGTAAVLWATGYGYAALGVLAVGVGVWALARRRRSRAGTRPAGSVRPVESRASEERRRASGEH